MKFLKRVPEMKGLSVVMRRVLSSFALILAGLFNIPQVFSAGFGVTVVDEFGVPLSDVSVCFGLPGTPEQFGSFITGSSGQIMVEDLPIVPLSVIVSKQDYQGVQFVEGMKNYRLIKRVTLLMGGEGPKCQTKISSDFSSLKINDLIASLNKGRLLIESQVSGAPTHYRISPREDFKGAKWQPYKTTFNYGETSSNDGSLYFQVKRQTKTNSNWIEARSQVTRFYIN